MYLRLNCGLNTDVHSGCWNAVSEQPKKTICPSRYCNLPHVTPTPLTPLENLQSHQMGGRSAGLRGLEGETAQKLWDTYFIPTDKSSQTHYQILAANLHRESD